MIIRIILIFMIKHYKNHLKLFNNHFNIIHYQKLKILKIYDNKLNYQKFLIKVKKSNQKKWIYKSKN